MSPPPSSSARLEILQGPLQGQTLILSAPETIAGRDAALGVALPNYREVSRRHARFYTRDGTWCIEDLGATNGTFVNGARVAPAFSLADGALIQMGDFQARFRLETLSAHPGLPGATQLSPLPPAPPIPLPVAPPVSYPAPVVPYPIQVVYPSQPPKNGGVAALLSFLLSGCGQFYNGETQKGIIMLVSSLFCVFFGFFTCGLGHLALFGIKIWSMIDAIQDAERINRESAGRPY